VFESGWLTSGADRCVGQVNPEGKYVVDIDKVGDHQDDYTKASGMK
jgi:hypothetical protein